MKRHSQAEINTSIDQLVAGLEDSGLDKKRLIVLGGGALAMAGLRPGHDLDVMVPRSDFHEIEEARRTPGGLFVLRNLNSLTPFLEAHDTPLHPRVIPTDITHQIDGSDDLFLDSVPKFDEVAGYHFLPPDLVAQHKLSLPKPRRKDRKDIKLIDRHLSGKSHFRR